MLLIGIEPVFAQNEAEYSVFKGVVKDSNTKEVLANATISVVGQNIGTVANLEGEFTIKIPKSSGAEYIEISYVGYANHKYRIADLSANDEDYYLTSNAISLQAVIVKPNDGRSLILEALDKLKDNYTNEPNAMVGFYRESIKQKRDYLSISEAVVDIYKSSYISYFDGDRVKIYKARKGSNVKKADTLAIKLEGGPNVMLLLDVIKNPDVFLTRQSLDYYSYAIENMVNIDNEENYVISFTPRVILPYPLYIGKFYIAKESKAITMVEFRMDMSDQTKASQQFLRKKPMSLVFTPTSATYRITYKQQNGKYYLNYVRSELKFKCDWKKKWFKNNYTIVAEMAITDRSTDNVVKFPIKESFKSTDVFTDKITSFFDNDYWGAYNFIEPEESIESAIKKFDKQFKRMQK